jgi:hypothetical protein
VPIICFGEKYVTRSHGLFEKLLPKEEGFVLACPHEYPSIILIIIIIPIRLNQPVIRSVTISEASSTLPILNLR